MGWSNLSSRETNALNKRSTRNVMKEDGMQRSERSRVPGAKRTSRSVELPRTRREQEGWAKGRTRDGNNGRSGWRSHNSLKMGKDAPKAPKSPRVAMLLGGLWGRPTIQTRLRRFQGSTGMGQEGESARQKDRRSLSDVGWTRSTGNRGPEYLVGHGGQACHAVRLDMRRCTRHRSGREAEGGTRTSTRRSVQG